MAGSRRALVVAVDQYTDPALHRLTSPQTDAEELAAVLGDPQLGDFQVEVLRNRDSHEVAMRLEDLLAESKPEDVVLIHFSCHGLKDDSGLLYLAAQDTRPTRLASTAVDATLLNSLVRRSRAGQVVILLDCCYGGAFERGMVPRAAGDIDVGGHFEQAELGGGRGRAVITASSAVEYAFEGTTLHDPMVKPQPSVFTQALTQGLSTGAADRDQDGRVALDELYEYVYEKVRAANPKQTPGKWEYGAQGQLFIARNPHRRVRTVNLPAELLELIAHPFPATRKGAVDELAKLALGGNLPLAAAARSQLARMENDDSRQVSTAAAAATEATTLRVSRPVLDFGALEVGEIATLTLELLGPPLVTASTIHAECEGLAVRQDERTLRLILDAAHAGSIKGQLTIDGPAGTRTIPITASATDRRVPSQAHAHGQRHQTVAPAAGVRPVSKRAPASPEAADRAVRQPTMPPRAGSGDAVTYVVGSDTRPEGRSPMRLPAVAAPQATPPGSAQRTGTRRHVRSRLLLVAGLALVAVVALLLTYSVNGPEGSGVAQRPPTTSAKTTRADTDTGLPTGPTASSPDIQPGETLSAGQSIASEDGRYALTYQGDGNLVLYGPTGAMWTSGTKLAPAGVIVMQNDGNLVIYGPGGLVVWDSATQGNEGANVLVQNDGNVVIYSADGTPVWDTGTAVTAGN